MRVCSFLGRCCQTASVQLTINEKSVAKCSGTSREGQRAEGEREGKRERANPYLAKAQMWQCWACPG